MASWKSLPIADTAPPAEELAALSREDGGETDVLWLSAQGVLVHARCSDHSIELRGYEGLTEEGGLTGWVGANVHVYRPRLTYRSYDHPADPAYVSHSSSSSSERGRLPTQTTVELLTYGLELAAAIDVADAPRLQAEREEYARCRAESAAKREAGRELAASLHAKLGPVGQRIRLTLDSGKQLTGLLADRAAQTTTVSIDLGALNTLNSGPKQIAATAVVEAEVKGGMGGPYAPYVTVYERVEG